MAITLLLAGGLGNQMFEYAAARALCLERSAALVIDLRYFVGAVPGSSKAPWLLDFPIKAHIRNYASVGAAHGIVPRIVRRLSEQHRRHRSGLGYDPSFFSSRDGAVLVGLYQSPRYFAASFDIIAEEFDLSQDRRVACNPQIAKLELPNAVGVHVRRGDYLDLPEFVLRDADTYYSAAMAEVRERSERAVVFSDDIDWCRRQNMFAGAEFYPSDPAMPPYVELFAMSQCKRLVIANSSFSWWAGWFAHRRGADIVAPKYWILGRTSREMEILPPSWRVLPET